MSGAGKLQWANRAYLKAVGAPGIDHVLDRQILLDQHVATQAQKTINANAETDETRHIVVDGERRAMRVKMFPLRAASAAWRSTSPSRKMRVRRWRRTPRRTTTR